LRAASSGLWIRASAARARLTDGGKDERGDGAAALEAADVALLVLDATDGVNGADATIGGYAMRADAA